MLGAGIARTEFFEAGVGSVFGVRLHDGRRVVVKVHGAGVSRQCLAAAQAVQRHLFADGFPAPEPLLPPTRFGRGMAVVEALLDRGERANAHDSAVRRTMAGELARLVERCRSLAAPDALGQHPMSVAHGRQWPTPHDRRFDFEATCAGAEWIDAAARAPAACATVATLTATA